MNVTYVSRNQKCEMMIDMLRKRLDCYDRTEIIKSTDSNNPFVVGKHVERKTRH